MLFFAFLTQKRLFRVAHFKHVGHFRSVLAAGIVKLKALLLKNKAKRVFCKGEKAVVGREIAHLFHRAEGGLFVHDAPTREKNGALGNNDIMLSVRGGICMARAREKKNNGKKRGGRSKTEKTVVKNTTKPSCDVFL